MKFTLSWLSEHLKTNASIEEIINKLTSIGIEVKNIIDNTNLNGFIVVKIIEILPHPSSDNLKICKIYNKNKILQIVCGANNLKINMQTVLASPGSKLPKSSFVIKPIKVLGVLSEGMLCSASELFIDNNKDNEIIELSNEYKTGDKFFSCEPIIDINITPNRGDCLSIHGIARDLSATGIGILKNLVKYFDINLLYYSKIKNKPIFFINKNIKKKKSFIKVKVNDEESFISGVHIINIKNKQSPKWLRNRLQSIGINSISAAVDVTNYIMISFGYPLSIYDAKKIDGDLIVRKANFKEKFISFIDCKEYLLNTNIKVISDSKNIHAIAGIINSKHSECTLKTTDVFLESSWFNPISIIKSSKQLGIFTDSSYRFTRSVDYKFIINALNLATKMILELCGGEALNIVFAGNIKKINTKINLDYRDINKFGSISLSSNKILNILVKLGFKVRKKTKNIWNIQVPSWRSDIIIPADIIEEVIRIYGYDKIKKQPLIENNKKIKETNYKDNLRILMTSRGFYEVFTWSFMSRSVAKKFGYSDKLFIIDNPFSNNFNVMRPNIIPNLLQITADNISRGDNDISIFEIGPVYNIFDQNMYVLNGIRSGNNLPRNHYKSHREIDVFDAKSDLITTLKFLNIDYNNLTIKKSKKEYYHPGKSGSLYFKNKIIGHFGEIHPNIIDFFNIKQKIVGFELMLEYIKNIPVITKKKFKDYKYQSVKRDYAFIINKDVEIGNITNILKKNSDLVTDVLIFDIYHGKNIEQNKISVALSVTFCSRTHTLTEKEIQKESKAIIKLLYENLGGILRDKN